jgi:anthranilate synthase component 2
MAMRHRSHDVRGVQFHPESVLTEYGGMMIKNWVDGKNG